MLKLIMHLFKHKTLEDFQESCLSISHKDVLLSELESKTDKDPSSKAPKEHIQRSFTLEEAAHSILFCSYIVHDMAYKAATIGMEKELATYESSHRTVTYLGSSISQKVKLKKLEIAGRMPSVELGNNVKNSEFACCNTEVPHTIDSTKPPEVGVQVQLHSDVGVSNAFDR
ncbi:hypothetical protein MUK42_33577 [Musa troglodytarum]|uniref:Uncharacterized protein n=1 Tax=Musa troglodytarum TaxID=320322 RepID=A0A9E7HZR0_9LILI|nr:hypothetical protein MUK42_33577 [Musa troglodytarum]